MEWLVVGGSASQALAGEVAERLNLSVLGCIIKRFPDGELYLKFEEDVSDKGFIVIQSTCKPQDSNIIELVFIQETLKDLGAKKIITIVPYFGYGRQDRRFESGEALSSKIVAKLIGESTDYFMTVNPHKDHILDFFKIPAKSLDASQLIGERFKGEVDFVLAPDRGAVDIARSVASVLGAEFDYLEKKRIAPGVAETSYKELSVDGKNVLIVDDIIDSGGTIVNAVKAVRNSAKNIYVACIHAVLSVNAVTRIYSAGVKRIVSTNTIPSQISEISVAPLISDALREII